MNFSLSFEDRDGVEVTFKAMRNGLVNVELCSETGKYLGGALLSRDQMRAFFDFFQRYYDGREPEGAECAIRGISGFCGDCGWWGGSTARPDLSGPCYGPKRKHVLVSTMMGDTCHHFSPASSLPGQCSECEHWGTLNTVCERRACYGPTSIDTWRRSPKGQGTLRITIATDVCEDFKRGRLKDADL